MIRALLLPLLLLGAAGCQRPAAGDKGAYPALTGRVVDQADLLTTGQEAALSRKSLIERFRSKASDSEIARADGAVT